MLNLFKKNNNLGGSTITLKLCGMHCTSCSLNIDGTLEDIPGILESNTSYAKSETKVTYISDKITAEEITSAIVALGYQVKIVT